MSRDNDTLEHLVGDTRLAGRADLLSEERFRRVWDQSRDAMRITDYEGTILLANPAYCRLVGKSCQELEGTSFALLYAEQERAQVLPRHRQRFATQSVEPLLTQEITMWNGHRVHLEMSNSFLDEPDEPLLLLTLIRDVSPRVSLEGQLRQAQKMDAIGRLAGGVAHDFNNLLTVINGYGDLVLARLPQNDPSRELLQEMIRAGDRAASLTSQLLAFSRKAIVAPRVLSLREVVADTDRLLRRVIGEDIQLVTVLEPEAGFISADPGQLTQMLLNLALNARDAMPRGGRLTIEVRNVMLDETYTDGRPESGPGPHVLLAVSDTGQGIPADVLPHIFDPFFTTKGEGKGTGLGLAVVHGVVKQAGGHVQVYSEFGLGTVFKVYLPEVRQSIEPEKPDQGLVMLPAGTETILLVEDEDAVRSLGKLVLQACGYKVLEASNGEEALQIAAGETGNISLLVTDVIMPRLGGRELTERLTPRYPGLKVLYCSGYTDDAIVRHGVLEQEVAFLQKPFSTVALAQKVRAALDR